MKPVGVALLGCGRIARGRHLPILAGSECFRVVAVVDPDAGSREAAAGIAPGCRTGSEASAIWDDDQIEAVVIASPNALHPDQAEAAFAAGKHIYVEKPLANDLARAQAVADAWRTSGRVGRIGFNYRFHPMHTAARAAIAEGRLGPLVTIQSQFHTPPTTLPEWKTRRATGGGALLDLASHHIDLVRYLTGRDVVQTRAAISSRQTEHDTACLELTLDDGVTAQVSLAMNSIDRDRIEVVGQAGAVTLDRVADPVPRYRAVSRRGLAGSRLRHALAAARPTLPIPRTRHEVSTLASLRAFAAAVRGQAPAAPDLDDALACLCVIADAEADAARPTPRQD